MRKISEVFYSLQGGEFRTRTPAVFARFSGCNLRYGSCDTRHEEGVMMMDKEIVERVSSFPARTVILTGEEPNLWVDKALISRLHKTGKQICIGTSGTCPLPDGIDWVTCSPKENAPVVLERIDKVEVAYTGQDLSAYTEIPARYHFLQPRSCRNTRETVDYILRHPRWRLSLQTHGLIDIQ